MLVSCKLEAMTMVLEIGIEIGIAVDDGAGVEDTASGVEDPPRGTVLELSGATAEELAEIIEDESGGMIAEEL